MDSMEGMFGLLGIGCGIYVLYAWYRMKTAGIINTTILLPKSINPNKCKDKEAYMKEASSKMLILGITALIYGATELCNTYVCEVGALIWIAMGCLLYTSDAADE